MTWTKTRERDLLPRRFPWLAGALALLGGSMGACLSPLPAPPFGPPGASRSRDSSLTETRDVGGGGNDDRDAEGDAGVDADLDAESSPTDGGGDPLPRVALDGQVRFEDRLYGRGMGLGGPLSVPAVGVTVQLRRAADGVLLVETQTDRRGRYELRWGEESSELLFLEALAWWRFPGGELRVVTPGDGAVHALRHELPEGLSASVRQTIDFDISATEGPAGAFNIGAALSPAYSLRTALKQSPSLPPLEAWWSAGRPFGCGSCFDGEVLRVGGGRVDPDEYDDPVIRHEFAHFVAQHDSRDDSPGGSHDGTPTDPALAWSEGIATFYGQWAGGDPLYFDSTASGYTAYSVDEDSQDFSFGTEGGGQADGVSENLVAALLWDLADEPDVEAYDSVDAGDAVLGPFFGYLHSNEFRDRGAGGVDLLDYLDGWSCHSMGEQEGVQQLLEHRRFPYDWAAEVEGCPQLFKPQAPLHLRVLADHGAELVVEVISWREGRALEIVLAGGTSRWVEPVEVGEPIQRRLVGVPMGEDLVLGATLWGTKGRWHTAIEHRRGLSRAPLPPRSPTLDRSAGPYPLAIWPEAPAKR